MIQSSRRTHKTYVTVNENSPLILKHKQPYSFPESPSAPASPLSTSPDPAFFQNPASSPLAVPRDAAGTASSLGVPRRHSLSAAALDSAHSAAVRAAQSRVCFHQPARRYDLDASAAAAARRRGRRRPAQHAAEDARPFRRANPLARRAGRRVSVVHLFHQ